MTAWRFPRSLISASPKRRRAAITGRVRRRVLAVHRHPRLHESGAGGRRWTGRGYPERHLQPRRGALRIADRQAATRFRAFQTIQSGRNPQSAAGNADHQAVGPLAFLSAGQAARVGRTTARGSTPPRPDAERRSRCDHHEGDGPRPPTALRHRQRTGGGSCPLPRPASR